MGLKQGEYASYRSSYVALASRPTRRAKKTTRYDSLDGYHACRPVLPIAMYSRTQKVFDPPPALVLQVGSRILFASHRSTPTVLTCQDLRVHLGDILTDFNNSDDFKSNSPR
jgi:hypothetical protein